MEDGSNGSSDIEVVDHTKNGFIQQIMAQNDQQENNIDETGLTKVNELEIQVNGDSNSRNNDDAFSSESDVLVIDESVPKKKIKTKKKSSNQQQQISIETHSNPYFNESIFELSQQHHQQQHNTKPAKRSKTKSKPKLREYAQYLGLQPTVQFKCPKCGLAGFQSFNTLQEHVVQCNSQDQIDQQQPNSYTGNGFKLTRKVFLCSACGTYYENWNLYIHMLEYHHRYICLYCLGMFSILNDLYQHIQQKHNLKPSYRKTLDEFKNVYNEPCYVICCECNRMFNEQDNFFYHNCNNSMKKKVKKQQLNEKKVDKVDSVNVSEQISEDIKQTSEVENVDTVLPTSNNSEQPIEDGVAEKSDEVVEEIEEKPPEEPEKEEEVVVETRKVPKLSLKLPKFDQYVEEEEEESDDSTKLTMETENEKPIEENEVHEDIPPQPIEPQLQIAGPDVQIIDLELEQPLDKFDIRVLLQKCLKATAPLCIYCNHARKIAVNGKQLGLHAIAEHRFAGIVNSITAEELIPENFVNRIKDSLNDLELIYFNLETNNNDEAITFSHIFECFPCRYTTQIHKELYLHNRKLHTKNLLLCIMCKTNFYNYSELICHLCPGLYDSVHVDDIKFRCCMCISDDLPSAFRLMVHLRKKHHCCDVCLELCYNQYKLSNHVWKHKLHHFCYRCGIAYRNKPDITRHLFWKHGTESVLCKKCLQKKWPHVYHFCVPPQSFTCDECNLIFSKAIYLKVHKRIHTDEKKHPCTFDGCEERFISKKLMLKHELKHHEPEIPVEEEKIIEKEEEEETKVELNENVVASEINVGNEEEVKVDEKIVKPKVDVYDLPELNLSESDSSDSETEIQPKSPKLQTESQEIQEEEMPQIEIEPIANIWDNFKNYQANKEKLDHIFEMTSSASPKQQQEDVVEEELTSEMALRDHDYFIDPESKHDTNIIEVKPDLTMQQRVDHDYCSPKVDTNDIPATEDEKTTPSVVQNDVKEKKSSSSDSSSDSDSSSCSCGSNCSCSSSSNSSSSTSDSSDSDSSTEEGRKRQKIRRKQRQNAKQKPAADNKLNDQQTSNNNNNNKNGVINIVDVPIKESDLETSESETDEEFYDKQPHKIARKLLEEKRNQLLAEVGPLNIQNGDTFMENDSSRPPTPAQIQYEENVVEKPIKNKKSKSKKRKKKKSDRKLKHNLDNVEESIVYPPITLTLKSSPIHHEQHLSNNIGVYNSLEQNKQTNLSDNSETTANLRASKRRRIPNKFYGYSSDEEQEKQASPAVKWRKVEPQPNSPKLVPPITIKTGPQPSPQPTVEPLSIRVSNNTGELHVNRRPTPPQVPPIRLQTNLILPVEHESDSQESDVEEESPSPPPPSSSLPLASPVQQQPQPLAAAAAAVMPLNVPTIVQRPSSNYSLNRPPLTHPPQTQLYCYCRCPYDEVSEMIGCDSSDCAIEWFHFECVGIMVPPKGQWFCPDCRKKKQQRRSELLQQQQQQT